MTRRPGKIILRDVRDPEDRLTLSVLEESVSLRVRMSQPFVGMELDINGLDALIEWATRARVYLRGVR